MSVSSLSVAAESAALAARSAIWSASVCVGVRASGGCRLWAPREAMSAFSMTSHAVSTAAAHGSGASSSSLLSVRARVVMAAEEMVLARSAEEAGDEAASDGAMGGDGAVGGGGGIGDANDGVRGGGGDVDCGGGGRVCCGGDCGGGSLGLSWLPGAGPVAVGGSAAPGGAAGDSEVVGGGGGADDGRGGGRGSLEPSMLSGGSSATVSGGASSGGAAGGGRVTCGGVETDDWGGGDCNGGCCGEGGGGCGWGSDRPLWPPGMGPAAVGGRAASGDVGVVSRGVRGGVGGADGCPVRFPVLGCSV